MCWTSVDLTNSPLDLETRGIQGSCPVCVEEMWIAECGMLIRYICVGMGGG